jgi:Fe-S cluster assembly ATP-binding protein
MSKLEIKNLKVETDLPATAGVAQAGGKIVVDDVSFMLDSGTVNILMGPNGSGKSSLVNAIMGHPKYKIIQGNILLDGKDITNLKVEEKAKHGLFLSMQYLPEIEGVTIASFLHRAYKAIKKKEVAVLDFFKLLEEKARELDIDPQMLKRDLHVGFSGGEKKLSELLQLFALEPKFALLDEIDSGVDMDSLKKVFKGITKLSETGTGFLLITHYSTILKYITPTAVHVMHEGKMVRSGGHELVEEINKKGFKEIINHE